MLFEYLDWICYIDKRYKQVRIPEWIEMKEKAYKKIIAVFSYSTTTIPKQAKISLT